MNSGGAVVDAVIVSYNNRETLRDCVQSLLEDPSVAVTVVDNASPDNALEVVADLPIRRIQSESNGGFGAGCNLGAAAGSADYVLLLNPDARLRSGALERMLTVLDAEPDVALVGPRLLDDEGQLVHSMRRFQRATSVWAQALYLHRLLPRASWANEIEHRPAAYDAPASPDWLSGACMLVRRQAFEAVGGFDDGFFLYCEDQDLCLRLRAAGGSVRYDPMGVAFHRGGHSAPTASLFAVLAQSRMRFARKHYRGSTAAIHRAGIATEALTHALVGLLGRPAHARGHRAALRVSLRRAHA